eukprot:Mrub_02175.p1 GENE.Mrub_02175~~Mrub_02175.p1  ORF type:complete len:503 (+),score=291.47 Mrub_02175:85-1593(+)
MNMNKRPRSEIETDWAANGVSAFTSQRLQARNITKMTEIQASTIAPLLAGKSVIGRAYTGSGKTYAFTVPYVEQFRSGRLCSSQHPKVLVLNPTRELVTQTYKNTLLLTDPAPTTATCNSTCNSNSNRGISGNQGNNSGEPDPFSLKVLQLYGGTDWRLNQRDLARGADVVIATPGRTLDLVERGLLCMDEVQVLVLDEADRMLDMGFKDTIRKIMQKVPHSALPSLQVVLFSATVNDYFYKVLAEFGIAYELVDLVAGADAAIPAKISHLKLLSGTISARPQGMKGPHGTQGFGGGAEDDVVAFVAAHLALHPAVNKAIVFCQTKAEVGKLQNCLAANFFRLHGRKSAMIHGDVPQRQRDAAMAQFKDGAVSLLVATDVCARGIDLPDLDLVVQCEPPRDVDSYVHRSGRTGRCGRAGTCVTFYTPHNAHVLRRIEQATKTTFQEVSPAMLDKLKSDSLHNMQSANITQSQSNFQDKDKTQTQTQNPQNSWLRTDVNMYTN